jgi:hypothetical protein
LCRSLLRGWPDLLPRVVAEDAERGWLLLSDAGTPFETLGNLLELWLKLLPAYGELQRDATVPDAVPDLLWAAGPSCTTPSSVPTYP